MSDDCWANTTRHRESARQLLPEVEPGRMTIDKHVLPLYSFIWKTSCRWYRFELLLPLDRSSQIWRDKKILQRWQAQSRSKKRSAPRGLDCWPQNAAGSSAQSRFDEPTRRDEPRSHLGSQARGREWFCCRLAAAGAERSFPPPSPRPHGSVNKARPFLSSPPESRSHLPAGPSGHERGSSPSVPAARHLFARALPAAAYSSFGIVPCAPVKPLLA
jgi:hypothetical protein